MIKQLRRKTIKQTKKNKQHKRLETSIQILEHKLQLEQQFKNTD
jgi:hypothetical protein